MIVLGTRPEVVKMAPVIAEMRRRPGRFAPVVCFTGQHRETCAPLLRFFDVRPRYNLDVLTDNQSPRDVATRTMSRLDPILARGRFDLVVVQGDTTSAFAAALLAFFRGIPVAHVEAGLRTGDLRDPYPEEMNRRLIGRVASLHFAPTPRAARALRAEGVPRADVWITGNTAIDALGFARRRRGARTARRRPSGGSRLVLVTAHRRESFGRGIEQICAAIADLVARNDDIEVFFPVHPNPAVRTVVERRLAGIPRVALSPPVPYADLVRILDRCSLVLTDSGGLQEEAPALGVPVVVMRERTERPEIVEAGGAVLTGPRRRRIVAAAERILGDETLYRRMARARNPFGDGRAAGRIVRIIDAWLRGDAARLGRLRGAGEFEP